MQLLHTCKSISLFTNIPSSNPVSVSSKFTFFCTFQSPKPSIFTKKSQILRTTRVAFTSQDNVSNGFSSTQLPQEESQELELLNKPSLAPTSNGSPLELQNETEEVNKDEALEPFLKFFKAGEENEEENEFTEQKSEGEVVEESVNVEYYEPNKGDFVVGVVVSGNENKIDVNVGAEMLGVMLTKEVLPLYSREMEYLLCDLRSDAEEFMVRGKMGIVKDDDAMNVEPPMSSRPIVEPGTVLFAEVMGRTLGGRPLLSMRRLFRRIAWHRVRQIKELNEPFEVKITEWNTGGLLTRIEGLRAFLPKTELLNRTNTFNELKENVGRRMSVLISRVNEDTNYLVLSEKVAWELTYLQEGTLLEGYVNKIFPYGAQIRITETNRSGLLHISKISRARVTSVSDLLTVDEKVKVLVVKSMFPGKISLSLADLESEPGLFLSDKEKVFSEAEEMAKKYRQKLPASLTRNTDLPPSAPPFDNEASTYANWKWFKFVRHCNQEEQ